MAHDDGETNRNTVFIDTSLDTHIATIVSDTDTVSDLKKKIIVEHKQCFPAIGDIKIHCLKVKRRGNFYHLSESLLVKSAFGATTKNWFLSVDASRLEQHGEIQHLVKHKAGDKLALPWVTDSRSIDRHDSHADRPSNLSLVHGSPSMHPKIVPFVNQRVPSVNQSASGDSCKDVSENMEEYRSFDDNHWRTTKPDSENKLDPNIQEKRVNEEIKSKKRIREVHNEGSFEDALEVRPYAKKKRKTERIEGSVKASEGDRVLTSDPDKLECNAVTMSHENSVRYKSKSENVNLDGVVTKPLDNEHTGTMSVSRKKKSRINKGKGNSGRDQLPAVVPSCGGDVGEEILTRKNAEASKSVPDVAMVLEKNIQQEMPSGISQQKSSEPVQKAFIGNEVSSSSMRTFDCERDAPEVSAPGNLKGAKSSTKFNDMNKDAIDASQHDLGSTGQKFTGDRVDKCEEDREFSLNQGPEVQFPERSKGTTEGESTRGSKRKKTKKSAAKNKDKSLVKHADDDIRSTVPTPAFDDNIIDEQKNDKEILSRTERNEVSEKNLIDDSLVYASKKDDDLIVKEVEVSQPTESNRSQLHAEYIEENSREELKDGVGSKRKKKNVERPGSRNDECVVKNGNDAATETKVEEKLLPHSERKEILEKTVIDVDRGRNDDNLMDNEVEISKPTGTNISRINDEDITDKSKKENEKMDRTKRKKKKTKRSAAQNEDESIVKHANGDGCGMSPAAPDPGLDGQLHENVKGDKSSLPDADRKDIPKEKLADISQASAGTEGGKVEGKEAELSPVSEANRNEDGMDGKSRNKRSLTSQSLSIVPIEKQGSGVDCLQLNKLDKTQDGQSLDEGLVRKAKKAHKSSVKGRSDLRSKRQSTELELEPEKTKGIKHHPPTEETSKNVVSSEVSKVRVEGQDDVNVQADIPKDGSHEIDFKHFFVPGQQRNEVASVDNVKDATRSEREKKPKKKTKELVPPVETSPKLQNSLVSCDNQQNGEQYDSRNDNAIQAPNSLSKNEINRILLSLKKTSEASTDGVKDPNFPNIDQFKTPKKTRKLDAPRTSKSAPANKRNKKPSAESSSSSSSETSGRSLLNQVSKKRKSSLNQTHGAVKTSKKSAQVVNSSQGVKSLLNTPGAIFGDASDESSADDNTSVNSDASTRTPSDKSSSSSESDSSIDSRRNGSNATKRKDGGGKNNTNSQSRFKSNISMADLLRSSSRFKKAKLTASQQMEDTESQPVDFVPESQPIPKR